MKSKTINHFRVHRLFSAIFRIHVELESCFPLSKPLIFNIDHYIYVEFVICIAENCSKLNSQFANKSPKLTILLICC